MKKKPDISRAFCGPSQSHQEQLVGWPKKTWGRTPTPKVKLEKPEYEDMGLFTDTVRKLDEKDAELAEAYERIRNLEIALKAARADKFKAMAGRGHQYVGQESRISHNDLNVLSESDVEELFKQHAEEQAAKPKKRWWEFFKR